MSDTHRRPNVGPMMDWYDRRSRNVLPAVLAVLIVSIGLSSTSYASTASEERAGARILGSVENGQRSCGELPVADFEKVGDYAMGRMVGSTRAHERMDSLMKQMMGQPATDRMHVVMGKRFAGCGQASVPGGFGAMMGVMNMMAGAGSGGSGMMGGNYGGTQGAMMGGSGTAGSSDDDHNGFGAAGWLLVGILAALLALAATALWHWRPGRGGGPPGSASRILSERYAKGEIDLEEFERRRRALGGAT